MSSEFICGKCTQNEDGFCDVLGIFVEDDDSPHCAYGKGYRNFDNYIRREKGDEESDR